MRIMRASLLACAAVAAATVFLAAGCGTANLDVRVENPAIPVAETKVAMPQAKTEICPACADRLRPVPVAEAPPVSAPARLSDIHFDYDKYNIRPGDGEILKGNLGWFSAHPGKKVRVEGYCDERGTVSHNADLGRKRADAAKTFLIDLGIDGSLLEAVSFGKERPAPPGHNKQVWADNRRVHFDPVD